jgi:hypothetical protein
MRDFRATKIPRAFTPAERRGGTEAYGRSHSEAQDCSCGKLNLVSAFLQEFVGSYSVIY